MRVSHHASSGCVIGAPPSPASANASLTYPGGLSVSYTPNALGQPTQAGTFVTNVSYWPNGAIKQFTYGNGIVHTLTRNARGLPEASKDAYGTTNFLYDAYDYDQAGNVAAITDGATGQAQRGNRTMSYDGLDRLTGVTSPMYGTAGAHYTYDVLDNLVHTIAVNRDQWLCYDQANRLSNVKANGDCSTGSTILGLGFDPQGNLANWNGVEYTFDYGNRLRKVEGLEAYRYDGHGRRVLATSLQGLGNLLSMYGQAGQLLYQQDSRSGQWRDFVYLGGSLVAERAKAFSTGAATVTYQHTDALGTPVAKTNASRVVVQRSEYEPFGKLLNRPLENGPGYTGHVTDAATQLTYMQQRYYDPRIGRFLSVDPIATDPNSGAMFNRYRYGKNNPYGFVDPDGRRDIYIGGAADKDNTRIVQDHAAAQQRLNPNRDIQYFGYREKADIATAISAPLNEGEPLNVVGHSLGGREAIRQANSTEVKITNLVTIDPVGSAGNGAKPSNVEAWTNVQAAPSNRNRSDTVASLGRAFLGSTSTSGAESQTMTTSHGNFPSMMSKSGAQEKVDASYQKRTDP